MNDIQKNEKIYVLDTNIILSDANNLFTISQNGSNKIVLPETVIDEIDSKKSGFEEINFQAREFGRILSEAVVVENTKNDLASIVSLKASNLDIDIISLSFYNLENTERSISNDRKIIAVAKYAKDFYKDKEVIFLTLDTMCKIRAISNNVVSQDLSYKKKDQELEFIKTIYIEDLDLMGKNIKDIDPDYLTENYCYKFIKNLGDTTLEFMAVIKDEIIHLIDQKDLLRGDIKPRNHGQFFALAGMLDSYYNVVLVEALAGSGKTLLAVAAGMRNVDQKKYDKIIYIRNSIESTDKGEDVGYLSGNKEKFEVYNFPLYDTLDFIVRHKKAQSKNNKPDIKKVDQQKDIEDKIIQLVKRYKIETMWIGAARGRTISNAYIIIDEIQNFSKKSLQTIISRVDENCKIVCIGSNRQIDNMFINKYTNGLATLFESVTEKNSEVNMFATKLNIVERGAITAWAERIFSKRGN